MTTDLAGLETEFLGRIAAAPDTAALEAVRLDALGKSGVISGLLTLELIIRRRQGLP